MSAATAEASQAFRSAHQDPDGTKHFRLQSAEMLFSEEQLRTAAEVRGISLDTLKGLTGFNTDFTKFDVVDLGEWYRLAITSPPHWKRNWPRFCFVGIVTDVERREDTGEIRVRKGSKGDHDVSIQLRIRIEGAEALKLGDKRADVSLKMFDRIAECLPLEIGAGDALCVSGARGWVGDHQEDPQLGAEGQGSGNETSPLLHHGHSWAYLPKDLAFSTMTTSQNFYRGMGNSKGWEDSIALRLRALLERVA